MVHYTALAFPLSTTTKGRRPFASAHAHHETRSGGRILCVL